MTFDALDPVGPLARELARERAGTLVAETCAWSVGLSDAPYCVRRGGRPVPSGVTLGMRAAAGLALSADEEGHLELGDTREGSFADALGALRPDGGVHADVLDEQVLAPFALETCVLAAGRVSRDDPAAWQELLDELGEDESDLAAVVRAAEWDAPVRLDAEQLVLAALGRVPLLEVEAEGLPLSLVRAAEAQTRAVVPVAPEPVDDDDLAGALFLAEVALREAELPVPVPADQAAALLDALAAQGLEVDEVLDVLPHLPVQADTAEVIAAVVGRQGPG